MGHTVVQRKVLLSDLCLSGSSLTSAMHPFFPCSHLFLAAKTYCPLLDMLRPTAGLTIHGKKETFSQCGDFCTCLVLKENKMVLERRKVAE